MVAALRSGLGIKFFRLGDETRRDLVDQIFRDGVRHWVISYINVEGSETCVLFYGHAHPARNYLRGSGNGSTSPV